MDIHTIADFHGVSGKKLQRQYKNKIGNYKQWDSKAHAEQWLIYPQNISHSLSIDEVALSGGELYTIVTSKLAKGRKGCIVAIIKGTNADDVIRHLRRIDVALRNNVQEITLDMSGSMKLIARRSFPYAAQVVDRFHVQQLASDALQEIRIHYRWKAIEDEQEAIIEAKGKGTIYHPELLENGESRKQLLARSRHLLYKASIHWTEDQQQRATILFKQYPDIELAYNLSNKLRQIYNQRLDISYARTKLALWYNLVEQSNFKPFKTVLNSFQLHNKEILEYFKNRSTNASAESFNAKIKRFRSLLRGVRDKAFFLFRLTNIFA